MERNNEIGMLDLMGRPAFCAAEGRVTRVNALAAAYEIAPGTAVADLLHTGTEEYAAFQGGCLHLTLSLAGQPVGASVNRLEEGDVFCLEQTEDSRELQAMALAAKELRTPLNTIMLTAQQLFPLALQQEDPAARQQAAQLNRGLFQILRVIGNMSDAGLPASASRMDTVDLPAVMAEIFDKAAALVAHTQVTLCYQGFPEPVYTLADRDSLERAVLNMVSNAVKFSHPGDTVRACLTRRGGKLYLSLEDSGEPIPAAIRGDVFNRYQRPCGREDNRFGIGLGMVLIRSAAAAHGGTVLMDRTETGNRITLSIAIRQGSAQVRGNALRLDYAGGWDTGLIELSESLPDGLYEKEI